MEMSLGGRDRIARIKRTFESLRRLLINLTTHNINITFITVKRTMDFHSML